MGSGKTLSLASRGLRWQREGLAVWTNRGFRLRGARQLESLEQVLELPQPAGILIDEAPLYFNARRWAEFPDGLFYALSQGRKDGLRLAYSAIHENMIDVQLRRMTAWVWHCRYVAMGWFVRHRFPPVDYRQAREKPRDGVWFRLKREVAEAYDTRAKVAVPGHNVQRLRSMGRLGGTLVMPTGDRTPPGSRTNGEDPGRRQAGGVPSTAPAEARPMAASLVARAALLAGSE